MVSMEDIQALADRIVREFLPERIVLFGSYAPGPPLRTPMWTSLLCFRIRARAGRRPRRFVGASGRGFRSISWCGPLNRSWSAWKWATRFSGTSRTEERCCMKPVTAEWAAKAEGDWITAHREMEAADAPSL